ncbi:adipokinetic hormone/corazonin-related peptide receptor variant I isoform X2 [Culicoides brevitarsis]|uniref:adipokinetic hormone/corazonin-related peptide receptor variant I isoform X2 n=1 Tax=Culicoides brevitarsis TaxID=469753 RepID=UPI00307B73A4
MPNAITDQHDWATYDGDNSTDNTSLPIDMRFNDGHRLQIMVYSTLMLISAIGNLTVLTMLIKRRKPGSSRIEIMLTHLAIADLLVTFLLMPLEIGWAATVSWKAGDLMCRVMSFFRVFGLYLSSFILVCISIDRYFAVLKPLSLSENRGKIMIAVAWFLSCVCSTPQIFIFHLETHPNVTWYEQCVSYNIFENPRHETYYVFFGMFMMYAVPLTVVIFSYSSIYFEIFRRTRISNIDRFRRSSVEVLSRAKRRTLRMSFTIVLVFVVCWTPFYVMSIWYMLDRVGASAVDQRIQKCLFLFACTNSCMNPIVYGVYNIRNDRKNMSSQYGQNSKKMIRSRDSSRTICISMNFSSCGDSIEIPIQK